MAPETGARMCRGRAILLRGGWLVTMVPGSVDVLMLRADTPNRAPVSDPAGAVVHAAGTHNVDAVYVAGRTVDPDAGLPGGGDR